MSKEVPLYYKGVEVGTAMVMTGYTFRMSFDPKTDKVEFKKYGELKWKSSVEDESIINILFKRFEKVELMMDCELIFFDCIN